MLKNGGCSWNG